MAMTPAQKLAKAKATAEKLKARIKASAAKLKAERKKNSLKVVAEIDGPRPMSPFDFEFCQEYCRVGKQEVAYRNLRPDLKDCASVALAMMKRPEIREHIRAIFGKVSSNREKTAAISARSLALTLEVADDRLLELMETRRRNRGEMLTKDTKQLLIEGAKAVRDDFGNIIKYDFTDDLSLSLVEEGAPIEDSDLLKAIDLTFKRRQGIVKPEKKPEVTFIHNMLYRPSWFGKEPQTIEGQV